MKPSLKLCFVTIVWGSSNFPKNIIYNDLYIKHYLFMPGLFDTHCHLMSSTYRNLDVQEIIDEAGVSGVSKMCTVGYDLPTSKQALDIARRFSNVYAAVGIHPNEVVKHHQGDLLTLKNLTHANRVVAIGEIGLDYFHHTTNRKQQKEWFIAQLKLAKAFRLPVLIHCRDAYDDCLAILKEHDVRHGIMHCFLGTPAEAQAFIKQGFYISFSGVATFTNAKKLQATISTVPISKIVLETDAPYLAPVPYRGRINFPKYLPYVGKRVAAIKNINYEELVQITSFNANKVLNISD